MPKTSSDLPRQALNGPTMGTRWQALFHAVGDGEPIRAAMAAAVAEVDAQMSVWKPDSDVNRLSAARVGAWVDLPQHLMAVLARGVQIGKQSGGAFDIGLGDATLAWGFGPEPAQEAAILAARQALRRPAHEVLELDVAGARARKHGPLRVDLNGIAKGYGVDRLAQIARAQGLNDALLTIDGELRALGRQPDGRPWSVGIEAPTPGHRRLQSVIEVTGAAVATSGDYRHWVEVGGRRLSHTMDPGRGTPLGTSPASVTVIAEDCASADAWATAMMVLGAEKGADLARVQGLSVLFLAQDGAVSGATGIFARDRAA